MTQEVTHPVVTKESLQTMPDYILIDTLDNLVEKTGSFTVLTAPGLYLYKNETHLLLPYDRTVNNFWSKTIDPNELFVLQVFNMHIKNTVLILTHHNNVPIIFHEGHELV